MQFEKKMILFIILSLFLIITGVLFYLVFKRGNSKVVEISTFSCSSMEGFVFEYPVFEGWEVSLVTLTNPNECNILLSDASLSAAKVNPELQPRIQVKKFSAYPGDFQSVNPNGVNYIKLPNAQTKKPFEVRFYIGDDTGVAITVVSVNEKYGFNKKLFWEKVITTFRLEK